MATRILAGPVTLYTGASAGAPRSYRLGAWPGGDMVGQVIYQIKVLEVRSASVVKVELVLEHSSDPSESVVHSTPIAATTVTSAPALLSGQAGSAILAPYLLPVVKVDRVSGSGEEWVVMVVYETRKAL